MKFRWMFLAASFCCAAVVTGAENADAPATPHFVKPSSWEEFVAYQKQVGDFGTFQTQGKTVKLWEGIPGGLDYTARYGTRLAHDGQAIITSHFMATSTGQVISTGSGVNYWDAESKSVKSSYSGFDQGQLFTGHSTLVGIDKKNRIIKWHYTETSRGKTTEYFQTAQQIGNNRRLQTAQKVSGGDPWSEETIRENVSEAASATNRGTFPRLRRLLRLLR